MPIKTNSGMLVTATNNIFLAQQDETAIFINKKANELFYSLNNFNAADIDNGDTCNDYFIHHHLGKRLFFSIQNSAHILYEGIKKCNLPIASINAIDYGAGLGTLFMLGGLLGFKRFDYNDHLPEWQLTATAVCKAIGSNITDYITGDITAVANFAHQQQFTYHLIVSRNVIEHIYSLPHFYATIFTHNPAAITVGTTTANYHNPAMRLYHIYIHKKAEKAYTAERKEAIKKLAPSFTNEQIDLLAKLTRGKGQDDFNLAVNNFKNNKPIEPVAYLRTNTCDCTYGVWCEHLLTKKEYQHIIEQTGFSIAYTAGYWDTHYSSKLMNVCAKLFNVLINILGKNRGIVLSPFVNIITYK
jgi:hypothetical protein